MDTCSLTTRDQIDSECQEALARFLDVVPGGVTAIANIRERRDVMRALVEAQDSPCKDEVEIESHFVGVTGETDIEVRTYRPINALGLLPALVFIHGGGMCTGDLDSEEAKCLSFCQALDVVVVSLGYRKAPEHPYPAATEDCFSGFKWMEENADSLLIDINNVGVYGGSAGGGLAIAVALMARDRGGPALKYVMAVYPMIDDRNETSSSCEVLDVGVWDRAANVEAWRWYLNGQEADQYAAPARAQDLHGLPQAFIDVGSVDLFRDEAVEFAARLMRSGVETQLHVYSGAFQVSEVMAPQASLSKDIVATRMKALRRFIDT